MKRALEDLYPNYWRQGGKSTRILIDGTDGGYHHGRTLGHPDSAGCARGSDRQDMRSRSIQHVHDLPKKHSSSQRIRWCWQSWKTCYCCLGSPSLGSRHPLQRILSGQGVEEHREELLARLGDLAYLSLVKVRTCLPGHHAAGVAG